MVESWLPAIRIPSLRNKIRGQSYKTVDSIARSTESDAGGCCASNIQNLRYISNDPIFAMEMKEYIPPFPLFRELPRRNSCPIPAYVPKYILRSRMQLSPCICIFQAIINIRTNPRIFETTLVYLNNYDITLPWKYRFQMHRNKE